MPENHHGHLAPAYVFLGCRYCLPTPGSASPAPTGTVFLWRAAPYSNSDKMRVVCLLRGAALHKALACCDSEGQEASLRGSQSPGSPSLTSCGLSLDHQGSLSLQLESQQHCFLNVSPKVLVFIACLPVLVCPAYFLLLFS